MQPEMLPVFLALLLAHLLGDFPLQTAALVRRKLALRLDAYLWHGAIHLLLAAAALALFTPVDPRSRPALGGLAFLAAAHLALDLGKATAIRKAPRLDGAGLYAADQLLHVVVVALATLIVLGAYPDPGPALTFWAEVRLPLLVTLVIVAATVFPTGYLIRYLLAPLSRQLAATRDDGADADAAAEGLSNAGLYLGWLERALLVIAFGFGSMAAVGLIIGAKSVARFPEFKSRAFAEYFLIGTLISVTIAALGGAVLYAALRQLR